jgi:pilus assembly protein CpaE
MLIGTAPKADPDLILRGMRSGVQEFLVAPPDANDLAGALDRLVRRTTKETQRGLVVAVYSGKGGLGTTSVAINLAYGFAKNHADRRVALADFVMGGGDVRVLLNLKPAYDVGDLAVKMDRVDEELLFSVLSSTTGRCLGAAGVRERGGFLTCSTRRPLPRSSTTSARTFQSLSTASIT